MKLFVNNVNGLLCLLLCWCASAAAVESVKSVTVQVHEKSSVAQHYATLADVATLSGDTHIIAVIQALTVVELPDMMPRRVDEQTIRMTLGREITARLDIRGVGTVQRAAMVISEETLTNAAQTAFDAGSDELVFTLLRHSGPVSIAAGETPRLIADTLDKQPSGDIPVRVRTLRGEVELARSLITLRVQRFRSLVVTAKALPRGARIGPEDMRMERTLITKQHHDAIFQPDTIYGFEVRSPIPLGAVVLKHQVMQLPDIASGVTVELVVATEQFHLSTAAVALSSGYIGDVINVRRQSDGRSVRGRIQANRTVLFER